jgi:hypothetical protein
MQMMISIFLFLCASSAFASHHSDAVQDCVDIAGQGNYQKCVTAQAGFKDCVDAVGAPSWQSCLGAKREFKDCISAVGAQSVESCIGSS